MHLGSALVSTAGPPHGGNLMEGSGGCWAGAVEQNRGPQLPSLRLIQGSERCICTDSHPVPTAERRRIFRCTLYRDSHLRRPRERQRSSLRLLLPSPSTPACGPRFEKFRHTAAPDAPRLCSRLHRHRPYCRMNSCTQMAHRIVPQCPVEPGTFPSLPTSPFRANHRR